MQTLPTLEHRHRRHRDAGINWVGGVQNGTGVLGDTGAIHGTGVIEMLVNPCWRMGPRGSPWGIERGADKGVPWTQPWKQIHRCWLTQTSWQTLDQPTGRPKSRINWSEQEAEKVSKHLDWTSVLISRVFDWVTITISWKQDLLRVAEGDRSHPANWHGTGFRSARGCWQSVWTWVN